MRKFGPKAADHPSVGNPCPACHTRFAGGDFTTLITFDPGNDPEVQERARDGRVYNAVAVEIHWACATREVLTCPDE